MEQYTKEELHQYDNLVRLIEDDNPASTELAYTFGADNRVFRDRLSDLCWLVSDMALYKSFDYQKIVEGIFPKDIVNSLDFSPLNITWKAIEVIDLIGLEIDFRLLPNASKKSFCITGDIDVSKFVLPPIISELYFEYSSPSVILNTLSRVCEVGYLNAQYIKNGIFDDLDFSKVATKVLFRRVTTLPYES